MEQLFLPFARLSIVSEMAAAQLPAEQRPQPSSTRVPPSPVPSEPCLGAGPPKPPRDPLRMSARDLGSRCANHGHGLFASHAQHLQLQREGRSQGHQYSGGRWVKRRDSHLRRHTLQGGVDFSMVSGRSGNERDRSDRDSGVITLDRPNGVV